MNAFLAYRKVLDETFSFPQTVIAQTGRRFKVYRTVMTRRGEKVNPGPAMADAAIAHFLQQSKQRAQFSVDVKLKTSRMRLRGYDTFYSVDGMRRWQGIGRHALASGVSVALTDVGVQVPLAP